MMHSESFKIIVKLVYMYNGRLHVSVSHVACNISQHSVYYRYHLLSKAQIQKLLTRTRFA
jgi:hypothetical protein